MTIYQSDDITAPNWMPPGVTQEQMEHIHTTRDERAAAANKEIRTNLIKNGVFIALSIGSIVVGVPWFILVLLLCWVAMSS